MAKQFSMQLAGLGPHWQASKLNIVEADVIGNVDTDNVYISLGDTIELYRGVEIIETVNFLVNWMRDHNQVSSTGGAIYTSCEVSDRHATVLQTTDRVLIKMAHIKMMHAVKIRKALEAGEDVGDVAASYGISVDQALGYLPAKVKASDEVEEDTRSPQQKAADTRKSNKEAKEKDDFAS